MGYEWKHYKIILNFLKIKCIHYSKRYLIKLIAFWQKIIYYKGFYFKGIN